MSTLKLTEKQEKFCRELVKTGNKTKAYKAAYDTSNMLDKTINERASRLSKEYKISARLKQMREKIEEKAEITVGKVANNLYRIMEEDGRDRVPAADKADETPRGV